VIPLVQCNICTRGITFWPTLYIPVGLNKRWWDKHYGSQVPGSERAGHFAPASESSRERYGQGANWRGSDQIGQGAKGPGSELARVGSYSPIRSWERTGLGANRFSTV